MRTLWGAAVCGLVGLVPVAGEVYFRQDFEGAAEVKPWATNAKQEAVFNGAAAEAAFAGQRGWRLEVLLDGGHYNYWHLGDCKVPLDRPVYVSGAVWPKDLPADKVFVTLGYRVVFPGGPDQGQHEGPIKVRRLPAATGSFVAQVGLTTDSLAEARSRGTNTTGAYLSGLYLHIQTNYGTFGGAQPTRVVVYLDELQVADTYPKDLVVRAQTGDLQGRLAGLQTALGRQAAGPVKERTEADVKRWQADLRAVRDELAAAEVAGPAQMQPFLARFERLGERLAALQLRLTAAGLSGAGSGLLPFVCSPWALVLPDTAPRPDWLGTDLKLHGCAGETLSGTVGLTALHDLREVTIKAGELKGQAGTIPAAAVDLKVVKCWYQAGYGHIAVGPRTLVPELLVTDDAVELKGAYPAVRFPKAVRTDLPADSTKRFWVSLRVPGTAKPGRYTGPLTVTAAGLPPVRFEVQLRVLPVKLAPAARDYGIFTHFYADPAKLPPDRFRLYCRDLAAHGLTGLVLYAGQPESNPPVIDYLRIAKQEGLTGPHVLIAQHIVESLEPKLKAEGIVGYFWTVDEPADERQFKEGETRAARIHAAGAKAVGTINGAAAVPRLGVLYDAIIWGGTPQDYGSVLRPEIRDWAYWQCIAEDPLANRYRNGWWLWRHGLAGAWPYVYFSVNPKLDPFDDWSGTLRGGYCTAYPTADGIIGTVQWEAYREGIQDMRYLASLEAAIQRGEGRPKQARAVAAARALLAQLRERTPTRCEELDGWRGDVVAALLALQ